MEKLAVWQLWLIHGTQSMPDAIVIDQLRINCSGNP